MTIAAGTLTNSPRRRPSATAGRTNQPDPRPLTEYQVAYSEPSTPDKHGRITVTLAQPCVVRQPKWTVIDTADGSVVQPVSTTVVSNTEFYIDFENTLPASCCIVNVPWQDMQVQNFQGGFVRPGGQWFHRE